MQPTRESQKIKRKKKIKTDTGSVSLNQHVHGINQKKNMFNSLRQGSGNKNPKKGNTDYIPFDVDSENEGHEKKTHIGTTNSTRKSRVQKNNTIELDSDDSLEKQDLNNDDNENDVDGDDNDDYDDDDDIAVVQKNGPNAFSGIGKQANTIAANSYYNPASSGVVSQMMDIEQEAASGSSDVEVLPKNSAFNVESRTALDLRGPASASGEAGGDGRNCYSFIEVKKVKRPPPPPKQQQQKNLFEAREMTSLNTEQDEEMQIFDIDSNKGISASALCGSLGSSGAEQQLGTKTEDSSHSKRFLKVPLQNQGNKEFSSFTSNSQDHRTTTQQRQTRSNQNQVFQNFDKRSSSSCESYLPVDTYNNTQEHDVGARGGYESSFSAIRIDEVGIGLRDSKPFEKKPRTLPTSCSLSTRKLLFAVGESFPGFVSFKMTSEGFRGKDLSLPPKTAEPDSCERPKAVDFF